MSMTIRRATEDDVPAIRDIYNYEILNGYATFDLEPQTLEDRLAWLREVTPPHYVLVAEDGGQVLGWASLKAFREREAYRFTAEDSVYIHQDHRGRGIGRAILGRLVELGRENGFHTIVAGISMPNEASERLHASFGFERVGQEREVGYKFERWIDVLWMQLMLEGA